MQMQAPVRMDEERLMEIWVPGVMLQLSTRREYLL